MTNLVPRLALAAFIIVLIAAAIFLSPPLPACPNGEVKVMGMNNWWCVKASGPG